MSNKLTYLIAGALLAIMFISAFTSYLGDSTTMDELAHIPAGYSYLSQRDFRINPEHPPLIKDLAALPLLRQDLNFPDKNQPYWEGINEQWWYGAELLYESGNDIEPILLWSRLPMVLVLVFLGLFLFLWVRELAGNAASLLTLTIFSFSPTFLAHGRLVTTDVAAALGVVMGTYFWLKFLKNPNWKNIILAGLIFGLVMLFKFSLILLLPFFAVITIVAVFLKFKDKGIKQLFLGLFKYTIFALVIFAIGAIFIIWPVYQFHVSNYPIEKQASDTKHLLETSPMPTMKNICIWMAERPLFRPLAHYLLGLLMATQRTAAGNTVYFMGMISNTGWWYYFPLVYFLKIPLAFHILTLIALFWVVYLIKKPFWQKPCSRVAEWIKAHFPEFSMMVFIAIYWITSLIGSLNIGVRHILPTFPFLYILVSLGIIGLIRIKKERKWPIFLLAILLVWYIGTSLATWPYYLSYFNEIGGGKENGYEHVVDSNYDWGQDLKRLKKWLDENNIDKVYLDYFGGSNTRYYLGEKFESWQGKNSPKDFPKGNYLAVSATLLQGGRGNLVPGFNEPAGFYRWLDDYKSIRIGTSIFVYYIE
jgi:hypothetical protein